MVSRVIYLEVGRVEWDMSSPHQRLQLKFQQLHTASETSNAFTSGERVVVQHEFGLSHRSSPMARDRTFEQLIMA